MNEKKIQIATLEIFDTDQTLLSNPFVSMKRTPEFAGDKEIFAFHLTFAHFFGQTISNGFLILIDPRTIEMSIADVQCSADHFRHLIVKDLISSQRELGNSKAIIHHETRRLGHI